MSNKYISNNKEKDINNKDNNKEKDINNNNNKDITNIINKEEKDVNRFADLKTKIEEPKERVEHIEKELSRLMEDGGVSHRMKTAMADYIIGNSKKDAMDKSILTLNRMATVNKREISRQGLVDKLEGGDDTFHMLIKEDKNTILTPKMEITEEDIETVPGLKALRINIDQLAKDLKEGNIEESKIKKSKQILIEMRKDQYVLVNMYKQPIFSRGTGGGDILDKTRIHASFTDEETIKSLLVELPFLESEHADNPDSDIKWVLEDLKDLISRSLKNEPSLFYILNMKSKGYTNKEIKEGLEKNFGLTHREEYISSLYRKRIPKKILKTAEEDFVNFMFLNHFKGTYKQCSSCKEIKLENNRNFSINKTSSSKYYSICKECRNKKNQGK